MTQGQVECYLAVVNEGSFTKAANALYISQPAISKSISKLEEELGFRLLERKNGVLRTTQPGQLLFQFLMKSREEFRGLMREIQSSLHEESGTVRLGCPETWNPAIFYIQLSTHFAERFPSVKLIIESNRLPELLNRLRAGKLDMVMTHEFYPPVQYGLSIRRLTETGCGILYSNTYFHNISTLADLRDADFLLFDSDVEKKFSLLIKRICNGYGFVPTIRNCGQFSSALFRMSCGSGVMLFTEWDNAITNTAYGYLPLDYRSPVNLIYPTMTDNPKTHLFAEELERMYGG